MLALLFMAPAELSRQVPRTRPGPSLTLLAREMRLPIELPTSTTGSGPTNSLQRGAPALGPQRHLAAKKRDQGAHLTKSQTRSLQPSIVNW